MLEIDVQIKVYKLASAIGKEYTPFKNNHINSKSNIDNAVFKFYHSFSDKVWYLRYHKTLIF